MSKFIMINSFQSFIHISTAYSNWYELDVKEQFYPAEFDPQYIIDLCNTSSDDQINEVRRERGDQVK